jgi:hypothetical protein
MKIAVGFADLRDSLLFYTRILEGIEMMTGTTRIDHKKTLYSMVEAACEYEQAGNPTLRDQMLRSIENVPLPPELVCAVLDNVGLLRTYQGPRP